MSNQRPNDRSSCPPYLPAPNVTHNVQDIPPYDDGNEQRATTRRISAATLAPIGQQAYAPATVQNTTQLLPRLLELMHHVSHHSLLPTSTQQSPVSPPSPAGYAESLRHGQQPQHSAFQSSSNTTHTDPLQPPHTFTQQNPPQPPTPPPEYYWANPNMDGDMHHALFTQKGEVVHVLSRNSHFGGYCGLGRICHREGYFSPEHHVPLLEDEVQMYKRTIDAGPDVLPAGERTDDEVMAWMQGQSRGKAKAFLGGMLEWAYRGGVLGQWEGGLRGMMLTLPEWHPDTSEDPAYVADGPL